MKERAEKSVLQLSPFGSPLVWRPYGAQVCHPKLGHMTRQYQRAQRRIESELQNTETHQSDMIMKRFLQKQKKQTDEVRLVNIC